MLHVHTKITTENYRAENNTSKKNNTIQHITPKFWRNYTAYMKHSKMLHITRAHKNVKVHRGALQMCILIILINELA
jgi:hypothetical protein